MLKEAYLHAGLGLQGKSFTTHMCASPKTPSQKPSGKKGHGEKSTHMLEFTQVLALDLQGFDFASSFASELQLASGFFFELRVELHLLR